MNTLSNSNVSMLDAAADGRAVRITGTFAGGCRRGDEMWISTDRIGPEKHVYCILDDLQDDKDLLSLIARWTELGSQPALALEIARTEDQFEVEGESVQLWKGRILGPFDRQAPAAA